MKTMKQIADEIGVDKQRVYRYIRKNHISDAHREAGVMWFDEAVVSAVIARFREIPTTSDVHHEAHQTTSHDAVRCTDSCPLVSTLQAQLQVKDQQIADLTKAIAVHAPAMKRIGQPNEEKGGFFSRIFRTGRER